MKRTGKTTFLARTAIFIALLIAFQFATKALGQLVTGSCVNLILAVCALTCGIGSAAIVAVISPFFAFLLGIGPAMIQLVPAIAAGNAVYVLLIGLLSKAFKFKAGDITAVVISAVVKFAVLFLLVTKLILPLLGIPEAKAAVLSASFSWPQLVTALIGGILAVFVARGINRSMEKRQQT